MSAGLPSGFGMGGSAAKTVANDERPNAVSAIDDRANALRVMWFCFILLFVCLEFGCFDFGVCYVSDPSWS
jgi:hypothetical protein